MTLEGDLNKFMMDAINNMSEIVEGSFEDSASDVIDATPVDTGRTKANWRASVGSADTNITDTVDPTGETTKAAAKISIPIGQTAYLTNSVSHIQALEFGTSKMTARPMIAPVVNNWIKTVEKHGK